MRGLALAGALGLALAGSASAELAVPKAQDGMLAVSPGGAPFVAYLHGTSLEVAARGRRGAWTRQRAAHVTRGSTLVAFKAGRRGPVVLVRGAGSHSLDLVRRTRAGWRKIPIARAPSGSKLGWPGLVLEHGNAMIAFTRWKRATHKTALMLVRIDRHGRAHTVQITGLRLPEELRRATRRARARRTHGARDRVVRHRRSGRDDRVASAERHLEGPVHRRRERRLPGRAAPRSGRRQRGLRSVDAGAPRRRRAARVARETRSVDRERLRARSRGHDRFRADPDRDRRLRRTSGCPQATSGSRERPSSGPVSS